MRFRLTTKDKVVDNDAAVVFVLNVTPPMMSALSRGANASDGLLDVVVINGVNTWQLIKFAAAMSFGKPENSKHYYRFRTDEVTIESSGPVIPNIDGDSGKPTQSLRVTNVKGAIKAILSYSSLARGERAAFSTEKCPSLTASDHQPLLKPDRLLVSSKTNGGTKL